MKKIFIVLSMLAVVPFAQADVCSGVETNYSEQKGFTLETPAGVVLSDREQATCIKQACEANSVKSEGPMNEELARGCAEAATATNASEIGVKSWGNQGDVDSMYGN